MIEVPYNYKNDSFCGYSIKFFSSNFFTIGSVPSKFVIIKIGIFLFPLILLIKPKL